MVQSSILLPELGLKKWQKGEILSYDAVLVDPSAYHLTDNYPYPITAIIEHENELGFDFATRTLRKDKSFRNEIAKLTYMRCALKVGITYWRFRQEPSTYPVPQEFVTMRLDAIRDCIFETLEHDRKHNLPEPTQTEYVFFRIRAATL